MRISNKIFFPTIASLGYYFTSLFINVIPCKVSSKIPSAVQSWSTCNLNPDIFARETLQTLFYGFFTKATEATLVTLALPFILVFLFMTITQKKKVERR